jgi:gluconokinase
MVSQENMIILLMGVSGVGKTTIGQELAQKLGWAFADADDYHPPANIAKMREGIPLDDADRAPWLQSLHDAIVGWIAAGRSVVLACSALKQAYRQQLLVGPEVKLVYLHGEFELLSQRLKARHGHYMNPELLRSQFDTLEAPAEAISVDVSRQVPEIVAAIRAAIGV